jgi:crotonobetaine/carnitine-CoA ligase
MNTVSGETIKSYIITRARNAAPTDVFLIFDDNSWRFKEVLYHEMPVIAAKTGNAFKKLGVDKGDKVNIHCSNCIEYVDAFFGLASILRQDRFLLTNFLLKSSII